MCLWLARVYAAGWRFPLKKYIGALTTDLNAQVLDEKVLYSVLWSISSFIEPLLGSESPKSPKGICRIGQVFMGIILRCFYEIDSIFYICVSRRAGMLRIHPHQYPRCFGTIKNISRYNLLYQCLVWLLSCIWNPVIRAANCLQSQYYSK